jgi:hypothetical protein
LKISKKALEIFALYTKKITIAFWMAIYSPPKKELLPNKRIPTNQAAGATQRQNPSKQRGEPKKKTKKKKKPLFCNFWLLGTYLKKTIHV